MSTTHEVVVIDEFVSSKTSYLPGPREIKPWGSSEAVGRFGKFEVEMAAGRLLRFLQSKSDRWRSFTLLEAINFYQVQGWEPNMIFFGLSGAWYDDAMVMGGYKESPVYLAIDQNGRYSVTTAFVEACAGR